MQAEVVTVGIDVLMGKRTDDDFTRTHTIFDFTTGQYHGQSRMIFEGTVLLEPK
ncbi:hypothetical protein ALO43_200088 [Pseudomonas tremae]|uniref:RulB protein n=1 Tax=Pseudomonas tremae TaxID=200454 RepID=A0AA40P3J8_9PSED|nr:hypothetical protein ALO43_200088 [Pseudomonas tremae]